MFSLTNKYHRRKEMEWPNYRLKKKKTLRSNQQIASPDLFRS